VIFRLIESSAVAGHIKTCLVIEERQEARRELGKVGIGIASDRSRLRKTTQFSKFFK
jgi:hypothetical protein